MMMEEEDLLCKDCRGDEVGFDVDAMLDTLEFATCLTL